jgi:TRAP-type C4-dicarboxylate transport system permease small subunit
MKAHKLINFGIPFLGGALLLVIVGITFLQIVLREFFDYSFNWSDEVAQFCITWMVLIGSIWVTKNNRHLEVGIKLHKKLNERQVCLIDGILALMFAGISALVAYQSAFFALQQWTMESMSLSWMKMGYVFIALPLFMLTSCYYNLRDFYKNIRLIFKKD